MDDFVVCKIVLFDFVTRGTLGHGNSLVKKRTLIGRCNEAWRGMAPWKFGICKVQ
jgi:hypothetical protein